MAQTNPKIVLDDHDYIIYKKYSNRTVWKCTHYFRSKDNRCKSKIVTSGNVMTVSKDPHNHVPMQKKDKSTNLIAQNVTLIREK